MNRQKSPAGNPWQPLFDLLDRFNITPAEFYRQRCDTYEKHLASRSIKELESFYNLLLNSAEPLELIQPRCPRWIGGRYDGKVPSLQTLSLIKNRVTAKAAPQDSPADFRDLIRKSLSDNSGLLYPPLPLLPIT